MGQNASSQGNSKSFLFFKSTIPPQELEKMYLKRKEIMKEIVETEKRYVKSLEICFNVFYVPLKQKKLLKDVEIQLIFSSAIEFIFTFHQNFLGLLEDRMKEEWTKDTCIADIFVKNTDFMKIYTTYVNNYSDSIVTLQRCQSIYPAFQEFLLECSNHPDCKFIDLSSFLIAPIQRIPRYQLLLADLLKNTPPNHQDYNNLNAALEKVKGVAEFLNEKKREMENLRQLLDIDQSFSSSLNLVDANRKLISEFDIEHQTKKKKVISVHLFFFNDCIIVASPDKSIRNPKVKWKLKERIPLEEAEIQDKINTESLKNIFEIIVEKKALIFSMPSSKAKEDFIKDFYWNKTQFKKELELKNSSSPKEDTPKKQKEGAKKEEEKKTKDDSKKFGTVKDEKKTKEEEKKTKDEEKKAKSSGLRESLFIRRESAPPSPDTNPEKGKEKESSKEKNKKK